MPKKQNKKSDDGLTRRDFLTKASATAAVGAAVFAGRVLATNFTVHALIMAQRDGPASPPSITFSARRAPGAPRLPRNLPPVS